MPDVASAEKAEFRGKLQWVGMDKVELPVQLGTAHGNLVQTAAETDIYVNLVDETAKGIHMSRLFLAATEALGDSQLSPVLIEKILNEFLDSHQGISDEAKIEVRFDYLCKRKALKSSNQAWRTYPIRLIGFKAKDQDMKLEMGIEVQYSSTCPCSAALSRQMNQEKFKASFGDKENLSVEEVIDWLGKKEAVAATPHAQRSLASVVIQLDNETKSFDFEKYIDLLENTMSTPVQAAVKREDEQEFARLNAENLMFSEDASRRLQKALNECSEVLDFHGKVSHFESLHPHDAVSSFKKNYD